MFYLVRRVSTDNTPSQWSVCVQKNMCYDSHFSCLEHRHACWDSCKLGLGAPFPSRNNGCFRCSAGQESQRICERRGASQSPLSLSLTFKFVPSSTCGHRAAFYKLPLCPYLFMRESLILCNVIRSAYTRLSGCCHSVTTEHVFWTDEHKHFEHFQW